MNFNISEDEKVCANCKHFRSYYAESKDGFEDITTTCGIKLVQLYKGDCKCPDKKSKKIKSAIDEACYAFEVKK